MSNRRFLFVLTGLLVVALGIFGTPVMADVYTIDNSTTIAATIAAAVPGDTTIILSPGIYFEHDVVIDRNIVIRANTVAGGSAADTIIDAQLSGRIFDNSGSYALTLDNLTLQNGNGVNGGAILNDGGSVTITGSTITGCSAAYGGAIRSMSGTVTITGSTITDCTTAADGGAIFKDAGTVTITGSSITGCSATFGGAILSLAGTVTIQGSSTISGCTASIGGAIYLNSGTVSITGGSTITGCTAGSGGAIYNYYGTVTITGSTITSCTAVSGGAIFNYGGTVTIAGTTITGCTAGSGGVISNSGSLAIHFSRIVDCSSPAAYGYGGIADAENNWWGTNVAPPVSGNIDADPWLVLGITADPAAIILPGTSAARANLTFNSDNTNTAGGGIFVPDAITNTFAMVSGPGSVSPLTAGTANGVAQTTYTPGAAPGTANISATVDGQTAYVELPVTWPAPAVTGITPSAGLNISVVSITSLAGSGFQTGSTVSLTRAGHASITATGVTVVSPAQITCTLPITGAEAGAWDVVVINPDGQEGVLPGGFTVTSPISLTPVPTWSPQDTSGTLSDFPSSGFPLMTVIVNIGGDSKAWQAVVTGTNLWDLIVTGSEQYGPSGSCNPPAGSIFSYLGLEPARYGTITNAVINFTVPQSWLDENHIDSKSIVLYHMTPDCWKALPTTYLYTKDGTAYFSGQSTGFSSFAIAGIPAIQAPVVAAAQEIVSTPEPQQTPAPAVVAKEPVTAQTPAPPAQVQAPAKSSPLPLVPVLAVICCIGLIGGGWYARRWWIRRQNPALFEEC